ncbi:MAG: exodeoxyribonuclease III [Gammaproteobacteria bacterium]|nr:exodeoxyribonuclease III [Gammaproteobacteria bacterium]
MRVMTLNLNGIRAAHRKGFFDWLARQKADVVCLQETKAQIHQLVDEIRRPCGYYSYFRDAQKPGYSGVAIYSRREPDRVYDSVGWSRADDEGRYIRADFGKVSVISLYLPSGTTGDVRQDIKYEFMDFFMEQLRRMRRHKREYIICGDWNIAHTKNDIRNWRSNQKNSGFLPEERAWLDQLFDRVGYVDAFRVVNQAADEYTWWSNRGRAWDKNVGWRIDYQIVTPGLREAIKSASIYRDERFSDHAPLTIDYEV